MTSSASTSMSTSTSTFITTVLSLTFLTIILFTNSAVDAHQTIAFPFPLSKYSKCSKKNNCKKSPCPSSFFRLDVNRDNPGIIVSRGEYFEIRINRNNHDYGFSRYALVSIADIDSYNAHTKGAFVHMCGDAYETKCTASNKRRDCFFDRSDHYYKHMIRAPTHAPDGVYVLGWLWYGGQFEDFHDCTFIEIRGGELTSEYTPIFDSSNSKTGEDNKCESSLNRVGACTFKICKAFGPTKLSQQIPDVFSNNASPDSILQTSVTPYVRAQTSVRIKHMLIVNADNPSDVKYRSDAYSEGISTANLCLKGFRAAIICEVNGNTKKMTFYREGRRYNQDENAPFDAEDSDRSDGRLNELDFDYVDTHFSMSCKAEGIDGSESWKTVSIESSLDDGSCK